MVKTTEQLSNSWLFKHINPINRIIYFLQLIGILIPFIFPLWLMITYEVIVFVAYEIINDFNDKSVQIAVLDLAKTLRMMIEMI